MLPWTRIQSFLQNQKFVKVTNRRAPRRNARNVFWLTPTKIHVVGEGTLDHVCHYQRKLLKNWKFPLPFHAFPYNTLARHFETRELTPRHHLELFQTQGDVNLITHFPTRLPLPPHLPPTEIDRGAWQVSQALTLGVPVMMGGQYKKEDDLEHDMFYLELDMPNLIGIFKLRG